MNGGRSTIDGQDRRNVQLESLRHVVGVVQQDTFMFTSSIENNVSYGDPWAETETIHRATTEAQLHDWVKRLPREYQTLVGERGVSLSGGQRQRLSIARALLTESPILILDEATSAVDNETEAAIQRSLARITHDRTMVVIAHRLSTIRHADLIYVIDKGQVAQVGTHDDLIATEGTYRALWNVQTGEAAS